MNYGVPYKGSKNTIARELVELLPTATNFYDLFFGGGAVTHAAMLHRNFKRIVCNDLDGSGIELFVNAIHGRYKNEKRWISREDFFRLKDTDDYIKLCWSFGNNARNYLYSKDIEPWKKALHHARMFGDFSLLAEFGIETDNSDRLTVSKNADDWISRYVSWLGTEQDCFLESLKRLQNLESLKRLQNLESLKRLERLETYKKDYLDVDILPDSIVYCDIPYKDTDRYFHPFDHEEFYDWCGRQDELVLVSSYDMPEEFIEVYRWSKRSVFSTTNRKNVIERLFVHRNHIQQYNDRKATLF